MLPTLGICGVTGRTGSNVLKLARQDPQFSKVIGLNKHGSFVEDVQVYKDLYSFCSQADVVIDFSLPDATEALVKACSSCKTPLVIGTTGLHPEAKKAIQDASIHIPIIVSANFSLAMAAVALAAELLSKTLPSWFSATLEETHHIHKKDCPSGTALMLQASLTRPCPITSYRREEVIGEHALSFSSDKEKIILCHSAISREAFAQGALFAANALLTRPSGIYSLKDLLDSGLKGKSAT